MKHTEATTPHTSRGVSRGGWLVLGIGMLCLMASCTPAHTPAEKEASVKLQGAAMGTTWQVTLLGNVSATEADEVRAALIARLEELEQQMSPWRADSRISQFNAHTESTPLEITADMAHVIAAALAQHELSQGAFDITAAPLVDRWGFGPPGRRDTLPTSEEIDKLLPAVDSNLLTLQREKNTWLLSKARSEVQMDLSALAKGYAVDELARLLNAAEYSNYLIEIGGELRGRWANATGEAWRVGLENPVAGGVPPLHATVALADMAIATSGSYRNFIAAEASGKSTYSHVIDPRTGRPIEHELVSVSVLAPTCMEADAWATTLLVLGPAAAWQLAEEQQLAACFITQSPTGSERQTTTRFAAHLLLPKQTNTE